MAGPLERRLNWLEEEPVNRRQRVDMRTVEPGKRNLTLCEKIGIQKLNKRVKEGSMVIYIQTSQENVVS